MGWREKKIEKTHIIGFSCIGWPYNKGCQEIICLKLKVTLDFKKHSRNTISIIPDLTNGLVVMDKQSVITKNIVWCN